MRRFLSLILVVYLFNPLLTFAESGWQGDQASDIKTNTLHFDKNLSSVDDDVQKALDTLDDLSTSSVSDTAYGSGWDGVTTIAPSKNAVYDVISGLGGGHDAVTVADTTTIDMTVTGQEVKGDVILLKDLVAGTGLSGGADNILPGADADVTLALDTTEVEATTWGAGGNASNIWSFNLSGTDLTVTFGSDLVTLSSSLTLGTGKNLIIGTTQWNSGDSIDGTKVANADLGDIGVASGVWSVEDDSHAHTSSTISGLNLFNDVTDFPADPNADKFLEWDDSESKFIFADAGVGGGASAALDNLASVAINTSLISDTAATDDLGTEALYWKKLYLGSDISFEGATDDAYQTTLTAVDTTLSDKLINIPNASGTMVVSATAPATVSALGDIGITVLKDIVTTAPLTGAADDVLPGADSDVTLAITVSKDIVAGVGLSGGEDNVLPGADADTTLTFAPAELEGLTWGGGAAASILWTFDVSGTDTTMTMGSAATTFSGDVTATGDLTVTGGDITLGTSKIFSGGDTSSLNLIDAIDATTETTLEAALDIAGEVSSTGMGTTVIADSVAVGSWTLTTPTISGAMTLSENASLAIDPAIGTDHQWCGITETGLGGATIAIGDLCSLHTDGEWYLVDANTAAASSGDARRKLGIAVTTSTDGNAVTMLLWGKIRHDAFADTLVIGDVVYASETAGAVEVTQVTTTDAVIRIIGYGNTADELFFCPSPDWITHT